jgi:bisphosphoglycerate-dependent phosphoglycerate mutase
MTTHAPKARLIPTTAERFQLSQGLHNWADRENMKVASKALNEMTASNSTLEELEKAAHKALAKFTVMSTPERELNSRIHELEEQIPAIEEYRKYKVYYKHYGTLEGKAKKKYAEDFSYEIDQYHECCKKLKELFPDGNLPKLKDLQDELNKARTEYADISAERKAYKKEADRLSRLARQKRDSQKTIQRYLQNEQAAKRKKNQLE